LPVIRSSARAASAHSRNILSSGSLDTPRLLEQLQAKPSADMQLRA
jgi:hypothetical protein